MVFEFFKKMFSSEPAAVPSVSLAPVAPEKKNGNIQPSSFPVNVGGKRRHKKRHTNKQKKLSKRKKTRRRK